MVELDGGLGPASMDSRGQGGQTRQMGIQVGADIGGISGQFVHSGIADADQANPALRPFPIKLNELLGNHKFFAHIKVHGGHVQTILQFDCANTYCLKQRIAHIFSFSDLWPHDTNP